MYYKFLICLIFLPIFTKCFEYFNFNTINNIIDSLKGSDNVNKAKENNSVLEDAKLNITELARKYKYEIEEHTVVTEDGYILNIHRLPPKNGKNCGTIFLMHGILDSSDSWVLQGPNNALAYILADNGYDTWIGNARGNKYSDTHTKLTKNESEYWKFSWEEIGLYDLPATIDYILSATGQDSLYYVGHSQGTTTFLVMNSMKPSYNNKIKMMFALSPIAWFSHAKSPIVKLAVNLLYIINTNIYTSSTEYFAKIENYICYFISGCDNMLQYIIGNDNKFINCDLMDTIAGHNPSTSSITQFIHYGQLYLSGNFCRFDFGTKDNLIKYGQETPPFYNLKKVTVPIVLFYSNNDWLSDVEDVSILYNNLPNVYNTYNIEKFNHFDYIYASVAKYAVYSNILKEIREFESSEDNLD